MVIVDHDTCLLYTSKVGKSRAAIANRLRLLKLPKEVLDLLEEGKLSEGHARALLSLDQPDRQIEAAKRVVELQLTVRETEKLVKDLMKPQAAPKDDGWRERDQFIYDKLEDELRTATGTKVVIQRKEEGKGKIQMDYYSIEELERLVDLFRKL